MVDQMSLDVCEPCKNAYEIGHWGDAVPATYTHCRDCHVTHPGSNRWGHCSRCHATFSGARAFDLHQTTGADGHIDEKCLCSVLRAERVENRPHGEPRRRSWKPRPSETLEMGHAEWGTFWSRSSDLAAVFRDAT